MVEKEGNHISLLYGFEDYSRYYEFVDGKLTYYKEAEPGRTYEWYIESLSPEADQSYFSTERLIKIPVGWMAPLLGWMEKMMYGS